MTRRVTSQEAAEILGVSRKTVERRIKSGQLSATKEGRRYIVDLPDEPEEEAKSRQQTGDDSKDVRLAAALAELEAVRSERDYLRQQTDNLSRNVSELTVTVFRLTETLALPPPQEAETKKRRTRAPWHRLTSWLSEVIPGSEELEEES